MFTLRLCYAVQTFFFRPFKQGSIKSLPPKTNKQTYETTAAQLHGHSPGQSPEHQQQPEKSCSGLKVQEESPEI